MENLKSIWRFLVLCLWVLFSQWTLYGQPILIVAEGSAEVRGGFSYDFIRSPLDYPTINGLAKLKINFPLNISRPIHGLIEKAGEDNIALPNFTASAQQNFNTSIDVSAPLWGGAIFFAARENASLNINGVLGNADINIDTVKARDEGRVIIKGGVNMPVVFDMYWRSYSFGFVHQPSSYLKIGLQIHKHQFNASTNGNMSANLSGRIDQVAGDVIFSGSIPYDNNQINGYVEGSYEGSAWAPEIAFQIGPLGFVSRMGLEIEAKGHLFSEYNIPFFIDETSFLPKYTEADSFLTPDNMTKLLNAQTVSNSYKIIDNLSIKIPQSHSIYLKLLNERLQFSYTKTFGKLETKTSLDSILVDSTIFSTSNYLSANLKADHIFIGSLKLTRFRTNVGIAYFDVSYRGYENFYSELLRKNGLPPLMPIWNFGFQFGQKVSYSLDFYVAPLPSLRTGVHYVF